MLEIMTKILHLGKNYFLIHNLKTSYVDHAFMYQMLIVPLYALLPSRAPPVC